MHGSGLELEPIFKSGDISSLSNYRPISSLPIVRLSKIVERAVHTQLSEFLDANNILHPIQSGFRPTLYAFDKHNSHEVRQPMVTEH